MSFKLKQYFHVKLSSMRKQIDAVFGKEGILVFLLIAFGTALVHWIAFLLPVFRCLPIQILPALHLRLFGKSMLPSWV